MSACRGEIDVDDEIPRLFVWCVGDHEPTETKYIEYGIEEEGVPWDVDHGHDGNGVDVAYRAATDSALKIGVSVTTDSRIVVHHRQLPSDDPMFDVLEVTPETARRLGSNSARLAKGTPLKPIE
ncbi:glycerol dehydratase reactivase beta/small subunit family protein [Natrialbaceae archaeon GCM10025810]|uniref:glycerol dehydratase reactivase beta/small subunit family protein n=1 Tax=Halovalidus salilacus TaxID=3075124 RepID=UPI003605C77C